MNPYDEEAEEEWREKAETPASIAALAEAKKYYAIYGNEAGGSLHIVLDDGNIEDEDVLFCLEWAIKHGDEAGEQLSRMLRELTCEERQYVYEGDKS